MLSGYLSVAMASQKASFNNNQSTTTLVFLSSSFRKRKVKYPPHGACYLETRIIESLTIGNLKHSQTKPPHSVQSPDTPLSTHFSNTPQSANGTTHIDTSLSDRPQSPTGDNRIDFGRTVCGNPPSKVKKNPSLFQNPTPIGKWHQSPQIWTFSPLKSTPFVGGWPVCRFGRRIGDLSPLLAMMKAPRLRLRTIADRRSGMNWFNPTDK